MGVHALCLERRLIKQGRTDGIKVWYMVFLYYWCDICRIKKETAVHLRQCPVLYMLLMLLTLLTHPTATSLQVRRPCSRTIFILLFQKAPPPF